MLSKSGRAERDAGGHACEWVAAGGGAWMARGACRIPLRASVPPHACACVPCAWESGTARECRVHVCVRARAHGYTTSDGQEGETPGDTLGTHWGCAGMMVRPSRRVHVPDTALPHTSISTTTFGAQRSVQSPPEASVNPSLQTCPSSRPLKLSRGPLAQSEVASGE